MQKELANLKRQLYVALLEKPIKALTESEVNTAYELCKDQDIQELLDRAVKTEGERL